MTFIDCCHADRVELLDSESLLREFMNSELMVKDFDDLHDRAKAYLNKGESK